MFSFPDICISLCRPSSRKKPVYAHLFLWITFFPKTVYLWGSLKEKRCSHGLARACRVWAGLSFANRLLHEKALTPGTLCTQAHEFLHQQTPLYNLLLADRSLGCKRVVLSNVCAKRLVHQECFTPSSFYTRIILQDGIFCTQNLLTPEAFCIRGILQFFSRGFFYIKDLHSKFRLHQKLFTPKNLCTRAPSHQKPFAAEAFCNKNFLHHFYIKKLLQQKSFTPNNFATSTLRARTPNMKQLLHRKA